MELIKTGECFYRDELGDLYLAESFIDPEGIVSTKNTLIEKAE